MEKCWAVCPMPLSYFYNKHPSMIIFYPCLELLVELLFQTYLFGYWCTKHLQHNHSSTWKSGVACTFTHSTEGRYSLTNQVRYNGMVSIYCIKFEPKNCEIIFETHHFSDSKGWGHKDGIFQHPCWCLYTLFKNYAIRFLLVACSGIYINNDVFAFSTNSF